ncbi:unnamed protein product, partial [Iphiclides podalirius]
MKMDRRKRISMRGHAHAGSRARNMAANSHPRWRRTYDESIISGDKRFHISNTLRLNKQDVMYPRYRFNALFLAQLSRWHGRM